MNKKGIALITVFMLIVVLLIFGGAISFNAISENYLARRFVYSTRAFWLADAGINKTVWAMNNDDWTGWTGTTIKTISQSLGSSGDYSVTADINNYTVTSKGSYPNATDSGRFERIVIITVSRRASIFSYAAFGNHSVTMSGNARTDSYDSSKGAYNPANNRTQNGDTGTNSSAAGAIRLSGNAYINGDPTTGPGGTVIKTDNANYSGTPVHNNDVNMPEVNVPAGLSGLPNLDSISLGGNTKKSLDGGSYRYSSITLDGNSKLTLNGDVKLYLDSTATALNITSNGQLVILGTVTIYSDGDLNISGNGVANKSSLPANCVIYCTDDVHNVSFSGNGNLCGAIYAPDAAITVSGNGDVYGSLVGNSFTDTGNGTIHYDEALKNTGLGSQYKVTSWKEDHG